MNWVWEGSIAQRKSLLASASSMQAQKTAYEGDSPELDLPYGSNRVRERENTEMVMLTRGGACSSTGRGWDLKIKDHRTDHHRGLGGVTTWDL